MFDPDWQEGCKSCSFWADNFEGFYAHLNQRDVTLVAISRAPWSRIAPFKRRMGWSFPWVSSAGTDFNFDCRVSFTPDELATGAVDYNYGERKTAMTELPGIARRKQLPRDYRGRNVNQVRLAAGGRWI